MSLPPERLASIKKAIDDAPSWTNWDRPGVERYADVFRNIAVELLAAYQELAGQVDSP